jgi:hypothetical protein
VAEAFFGVLAMPFEVPATINDENEWAFPGLPFYVTDKEFGVIALFAFSGYLAVFPILNGNLFNTICAILFLIVGAAVVKRQKTKHPAGWPWLWDWMLDHGLRPKRGLMKPERGIIRLSMHHIAQPSLFLTGASRPGIDLTVGAPWQATIPPIVTPAPMVPRRRRRIYTKDPSPAPPWFAHAQGFKDVVDPKFPFTVTWKAVQDELWSERDKGAG